MYVSAVHQRLIGASQYFLQVTLSLIEFALLHRAQPRLVVLYSLCVSGIFSCLFLGS